MATGQRSDFTILNPQYHTSQIEALATNLNAFNAASNGAIVLRDRRIVGDYEETTLFDLIDPINERDLTTVSAATDATLTDTTQYGVKKYFRIGPIAMTMDAWRTRNQTVAQFSSQLGQMVGTQKMKTTLTIGLAALAAKLANTTAVKNDITSNSTDTVNHAALADTLAKFGDAAGDIRCWVMHSKSFFDLVGDAITLAIPGLTDVVLYGGSPATLGRPVVVTDTMVFDDTSGDDIYYTLGLCQEALVCEQSEPDEVTSDTITGLEQLVYRIQGEYAMNFRMRGCKWNISAVPSNPTAAQMATHTNWTSIFTNTKLLPGVVLKSN